MKNGERSLRIGRLGLGAVMALVMMVSSLPVLAAGPDNITAVVGQNDATAGTGAIGAYGYFKAVDGTEIFYAAGYGQDGGIRKITLNTAGQISSELSVSAADWANYLTATPSYLAHPDWKPNQNTVGGFLLNPAALTIGGVTYAPGSTAYITDATGNLYQNTTPKVYFYEDTKRVYRYDLRQVGGPTGIGSLLPDYSNAAYVYYNSSPVVTGATGIVDWNDVFTTVVNKGNKATAWGAAVSATDNWGRQFAWSSDGQSIYHADSSTAFGGIWKINAITGAITALYKDSGIFTEVGVVHTSVRRLNAQDTATGDQIIFQGTTANNLGGINYLIDDGSVSPPVHSLFSADDLNKLFEVNGFGNRRSAVNGTDPGVNPAPKVQLAGAVAASNGELYFYTTGTGANSLWRYDLQGRLSSIKSASQQFVNNQCSAGSNLANNRIQLRNVVYTNGSVSFPVRQILFMDSFWKGISGVYDFKSGDFNRDNVVDYQDFLLFKAALDTPIGTLIYIDNSDPKNLVTYYYEGPTNGATPAVALMDTDLDAYRTYLKEDLNGNGLVTDKDIYIFSQFYSGLAGDANVDGKVDVSDLGILAANYGITSGAGWRQGDYNNDGKVDVSDLGILAANYGFGTGASSDFKADAKAVGLSDGGEDAKAETTTSPFGCFSAALPLVAGMFLAGLTLGGLRIKE